MFLRELIAVSFILLMEQRVGSYDFFNTAFVLFLTLIAFRTPYINSYAFLFEISSFKQWAISQHVGLQKHEDFTQNLFLFVAVIGGHIGAAFGAAALRVLLDVAYGVEAMASGQTIEPILGVNVEALKNIDTFWGTEKRLDRLASVGLFNGSRSDTIPLHDISHMGLDSTAVSLWYLLEEVGFVSLLCMCYVHIWLGAGLAKDELKPIDPFKSEYWKRLFRVSFLLTVVSTALTRCFPTAHGSLHHTIYKCQYQAWNPEMHLVDNDNQEPLIRVLGGFVGVAVAYAYNKILIGTRDTKDDEGFYYRMVWGREPVIADADDRQASGNNFQMYPERKYTRVSGGGGGVRCVKVVGKDDDGGMRDFFSGQSGCEVHTVCVSRCKKHPNGGVGCSAECRALNSVMETEAVGGVAGAGGFKLRIPYTLDHPK
jgi:hypothetical protein